MKSGVSESDPGQEKGKKNRGKIESDLASSITGTVSRKRQIGSKGMHAGNTFFE